MCTGGACYCRAPTETCFIGVPLWLRRWRVTRAPLGKGPSGVFWMGRSSILLRSLFKAQVKRCRNFPNSSSPSAGCLSVYTITKICTSTKLYPSVTTVFTEDHINGHTLTANLRPGTGIECLCYLLPQISKFFVCVETN
jgi:hypothetical protein